jgi:hypothetical protein
MIRVFLAGASLAITIGVGMSVEADLRCLPGSVSNQSPCAAGEPKVDASSRRASPRQDVPLFTNVVTDLVAMMAFRMVQ